jgi:hypothetical protein
MYQSGALSVRATGSPRRTGDDATRVLTCAGGCEDRITLGVTPPAVGDPPGGAGQSPAVSMEATKSTTSGWLISIPSSSASSRRSSENSKPLAPLISMSAQNS